MTVLAAAFALLAAVPASYDALVSEAVAAGRAGRLSDADHALSRAVALSPGRPEAYVERGGLRFLQRRYGEAARELRIALQLREDPYTREMLGAALLLSGRGTEAVAAWNPLGRPKLRAVELRGVRHTRAALLQPELAPLREGELLRARDLTAARTRLLATGLFEPVVLRPRAAEAGGVDVEAALGERHGFGSRVEVLARGAIDLTRQRVRGEYANLLGLGISAAAEYKWEPTQPRLAFAVDMVRPLGLPAHVEVEALRARPTYDPEDDGAGRFTLRTRGAALRVRRAVGAATVATAGLHLIRRTFDVSRADARPGTIIGWQGRVDHVLAHAPRDRASLFADVMLAPRALGGDVPFSTALFGGRAVRALDDRRLPRAFGIQAQIGRSSGGTPIDAMFAPGAASEMPLPLRAHRQKRDGVLGRSPIGRSLALLNLEWREHIGVRGPATFAAVAFYDGAHIGQTARGGSATIHDLGVGLRLSVGGTILRADLAHGLTDGTNSVTAGIGQVF